MIMLEKRDALFLIILFVVSLCIRAGVYQCYLSKNENFWQVDSSTYHLVAQGIAQGEGVSLPTGASNFYRLPGYPIFIAFFYKIFGTSPQRMLWAQVFLGAFIPILIFFLSLALFPRYRLLARIASGYSAIQLGLVLYSGFFMTETLFLTFFLLFCIFFFAHAHLWFCPRQEQLMTNSSRSLSTLFLPEPLDSLPLPYEQSINGIGISPDDLSGYIYGDPVFKGLTLAGIFLGLASLVRPVGHYLLVLSLIVLLFSCDGWRQMVKKSLAFFIPWLLVVMPWLLRNYLLLGHVFFHTLPGGHFLYLSASRVAMNVYNYSYQEARSKLGDEVNALIAQQELAAGHPLNEIERCYAHEQIAKKYFVAYPLTALKIWVTDMLRTCLSLYSAELLYLESGRKEIQYFDQGRSVWSVFARYLFPPVDSMTLKVVVWAEIIFFLFILVGFFGGLMELFIFPFGAYAIALVVSLSNHSSLRQAQGERNKAKSYCDDLCSWTSVLPFMALFIVIALAGGYARMRLPLEPLLIILSFYFYLRPRSMLN